MSRSKAKTKALKAGGRRQSDKKSKTAANKLFRRVSRAILKTGNENIPSSIREVSDTWDFSSDGLAVYWEDLPKKFMRK